MRSRITTPSGWPANGLAVMIGPLFEDVEAIYPYYRLEEAGATVGLIGTDGAEAVKGKKGIELTTDQAAADLVPDDLRVARIVGDRAEWEDSEVVVDGNLVAARGPPDLPAFMRALIDVAVEAAEPVSAG